MLKGSVGQKRAGPPGVYGAQGKSVSVKDQTRAGQMLEALLPTVHITVALGTNMSSNGRKEPETWERSESESRTSEFPMGRTQT